MNSQHRQGESSTPAAPAVLAEAADVCLLNAEIARLRHTEQVARQREQQLSQHNLVLVNLSQSAAIDQGDLHAAFEEITLAAAHTLNVARASIWLFTNDRSAIRCCDLYERELNQHSNGLELRAAEFPSYFAAIEDNRTLAADEARTDSRTSEFKQSYLEPLGITSMLDAPVRVGGRVIGVICHEHIGSPRSWTLEDQSFAGSMADFVALTMKAHDRAEALRAARDSERRLRQIIDLVPHMITVRDAAGRVALCNLAAAHAYDVSVDRLLGQVQWDVHRCSEESARMRTDDLRVLEAGQSCVVADEHFTDSRGVTRLLHTSRIPFTLAASQHPAVLSVSIDVSEQRRQQRIRELMIQELDHRVKNNLAIVLAIAEQTARGAHTLEAFSEAFEGRLRALAITHEMLARTQWGGADLRAMAGRITEPYARGNGESRVELAGESLQLPAPVAPAVCMILHELATNAAKHGALASPKGHVTLQWEREMRTRGETRSPWLRMTWLERGGPSVDAAVVAQRTSFGTTLIDQTVRYQLHGDVRLDFATSGLEASIEFPLERTTRYFPADAVHPELESHEDIAAESRQPQSAVSGPASAADSLSNAHTLPAPEKCGQRVLVVEDDMLVAQSLASHLKSIGCEVVGPASTSEAACALVKSQPIDAAILDINLSAGTSTPVARALASRNTPFAFVTGYSNIKSLPEDLRGQRVLCKPVDREMLSRTLHDLVSR